MQFVEWVPSIAKGNYHCHIYSWVKIVNTETALQSGNQH